MSSSFGYICENLRSLKTRGISQSDHGNELNLDGLGMDVSAIQGLDSFSDIFVQ